MGSINVQGVVKQYGGQIVLNGASVELRTGEIVGLVGTNGAGKTTLLRIVMGIEPPDLGTVTLSKGLEVGYLPQEADFQTAGTLRDEVGGAFADLYALEKKLHALSDEIAVKHADGDGDALMKQYDRVSERFIAAGGYTFEQRLDEVLGGLGFTQADHELKIAMLSGGQKSRAALGRLLIQDAKLLLLDEPTNHLDIDAVRWLEKFLAGHHGGAVIISHDRYLLDRLADRIVETDNGRLASYVGNYTSYTKTKAVQQLTQARQFVKDKAFIDKERAFIAKHMAGQRTKEAQGRQTRLERRIKAGEFVLEVPGQARRTKFKFDQVDVLSGTVVRADDLTKAYPDKPLFENLRWQVDAGQRLGITGPNGTGKSTLLKILMDEVKADTGEIEIHHKANVGYFAQGAFHLEPKRSIFEEILGVRPEFSDLEIRSLMARFGFRGDDVFKRLGNLSGGERSRVRLVTLLLSSPNVLVLDEPTNHLDIPSREALEEALADFPGTVIAVSHDRYFLDKIVDRLLVIRPEGHGVYLGNYSDYLKQVEQAGSPVKSSNGANPPKAKSSKAKTKPPKKKSAGYSVYDGMSVEDLEGEIEKHEKQLADLHEKFANPNSYKDPEAIEKLREQMATVQGELRAVEASWHERIDNV
jgi:ATP-binding cassette subfamily F protein 3